MIGFRVPASIGFLHNNPFGIVTRADAVGWSCLVRGIPSGIVTYRFDNAKTHELIRINQPAQRVEY
jgi:hypothetical protein